MHERKSKRIQHRRLQRNRLIRLFCISSFLSCSLFLCAQAQNTANFPTIKESPTERIHSLEVSQVNGLSEKTIPEYIELLAFSETQELANFRLANLYANLDNWPKAEIYAKAACELNPNNSDYDFLYLRILEKQFQYDRAWKIHQKLIAKQPRYISRYYDAISNCIKREHYLDALQLITQYQFHFGLNEYAHRIRTQCYLFLDPHYPQQHYLDSLLIQNEQYLLTKPKEFTPWVAFQINQLQKKAGESESKSLIVAFYNKMYVLQQYDSGILQELDKLTYEFPVLRSTNVKMNIVESLFQLSQLNKELQTPTIFKDFEDQIADTSHSLTDLDSLYTVLFKKLDFGYKSEAMVLLGNQYFIRGQFDKALKCFNYWRENEPKQSPFFSEQTSPETLNTNAIIPGNKESKESLSRIDKIKNDLLSIQNRYVISLYKMGKISELRASIEWYEENFPFVIDDATILIKILDNQLNKNWVDPVTLWGQIKMGSPILDETYFAQIDLELHTPNQIETFKKTPLQNSVIQWQNQGKIHPTLARDLIIQIYQSRQINNK